MNMWTEGTTVLAPSVGQSHYVTVKISELRLGKRDTSVTNKCFFYFATQCVFCQKKLIDM